MGLCWIVYPNGKATIRFLRLWVVCFRRFFFFVLTKLFLYGYDWGKKFKRIVGLDAMGLYIKGSGNYKMPKNPEIIEWIGSAQYVALTIILVHVGAPSMVNQIRTFDVVSLVFCVRYQCHIHKKRI